MRRHVRYRPLGKLPSVSLQMGMNGTSEAEIIDESTGGLGLLVGDFHGISLGQQIEVETRNGTMVGTVVRMERTAKGCHLGVSFRE